MLSRRALVASSASSVAIRGFASTRALLNTGNNTTGNNTTGNNTGNTTTGNETIGSGGYDRAADIKREEQARADLFTTGVPNPFRAGAAAATKASAGGKPPSMSDAYNEAMKEASKRFFGTEKPPANFMDWGRVAQAHKAGGGPAAASADSNATTATNASSSSSTDATASSSSTTTTPPPNPFANFAGAGASGAGSGGNSGAGGAPQPPKTGRLLAGLIITYCSFWVMRRQGFFGNFEHVAVPYWAAGPADSARWLLFVLSIDERRREEIQTAFELLRKSYPMASFFDFVDQEQPGWSSTPNFPKEEVIRTLAAYVAREPTWKVISTMRAGLSASDGIFAAFGIGGDGGSGLTPAQRRLESLMRVIPPADGSGAARPFILARPTDASGTAAGSWAPVYGMGGGAPPPGYGMAPPPHHGGGMVHHGGYPGYPSMQQQPQHGGWQGYGGATTQFSQYGHTAPQHHQQPQQQGGWQQGGAQYGHGTAPFGMPPQHQQQQQQWHQPQWQQQPDQQQQQQQQQQPAATPEADGTAGDTSGDIQLTNGDNTSAKPAA